MRLIALLKDSERDFARFRREYASKSMLIVFVAIILSVYMHVHL